MAREAAARLRDKVILFGDFNYKWDIQSETYEKIEPENENSHSVQVLDVQDIVKNRIVTEKYVFPMDDATIRQGTDGTYFCFNAALPYLTETAHLAEVEKNIIIEQAFLYPGKHSLDKGKSNAMTYVVMGVLGLVAIIGILS